jgi:hypothetical protein
MRDNHWKRGFEAHETKCKESGGIIVRQTKLDKISMNYTPHLNQSKTFTRDFILYDFETCEIKNPYVSKKLIVESELMVISAAIAIAHGSDVSTQFFSILDQNEDKDGFDNPIDRMINSIFMAALTFFTDEELSTSKIKPIANVIGFNSGKFDFTFLLPYLQGKNWCIDANSYIGSSTNCKQVIIVHKTLKIRLRFLDLILFAPNLTLKKFVETFGSSDKEGGKELMRKGVFPYEVLTVNSKENVKQELTEILIPTDPSSNKYFNLWDFGNKLTNSPINVKDYSRYYEEREKFESKFNKLRAKIE